MNEVLYKDFDRSYYCEARYLAEVIEELEREIQGFSIVVTSSLKELPPSKFEKIVILTSDEQERLGPNPYPGDRVRAVFRIFNREETCDLISVFPIPCGYNWRMHSSDPVAMDRFYPEKPLSQRSVDVFFAGQVIPSRKRLVRQAEKLTDRFAVTLGTNDSFRSGLGINDYLRYLGDTKIALVPDGTSPDTFRFVEAMASGCIIVMPKKTNLWYYRGAPVAWIDDWQELNDALIEKILSSDIDEWGRRAQQYYQDCLSGTAVAKYIVNCLSMQRDETYVRGQVGRLWADLACARQAERTLSTSWEYRVGCMILKIPRAVKRAVSRKF